MTFRLGAMLHISRHIKMLSQLVAVASQNAQTFQFQLIYDEFYFWISMIFYRRCAWPLAKISRVWTDKTYIYMYTSVCLCARQPVVSRALMMITITNLTDARFDSNDRLTDRPIAAIGTSWLAARAIRSIGTAAPRVVRWLSARPCRCCPPFDNHLVRQQQQQQQLQSPPLWT